MRRCFRYFVVALLVSAFAVTMPARNCIAVTSIPYNTIIWGPSPRFFGLVDKTAVIVCARNRFAAAMTILGYGTRVDSLTPEQMAYLSNGPTGGEFFTFANNVRQRSGVNFDNYDDLYGHDNVWYCEYSSSEYSLAQRDLETVLNGGHIGGGGTPGQGQGGYVTSYDLKFLNGSSFTRVFQVYSAVFGDDGFVTGYNTQIGQFVINASSTLTGGVVYVKDTMRDYINAQIALGRRVGMAVGWSNNGDPGRSIVVRLMSWDDSVSSDVRGTAVYLPAGQEVWSTGPISMGTSFTSITYPSYFLNWSYDFTVHGNASSSSGLSPIYGNIFLYGEFDSTNPDGNPSPDEPVVPPSNWPDAPEVTTPTAPEVPEPSDPETPAQPAQPTAPTLPNFPSNVIAPGTTYETFDIQAILQAMDEHCQHLQSAIYQGFSDYFDTFTPWLRDEFSTLRTFLREEDDWIVESISDEFMELRSYLKELAEWLADQMDFTITGGDYDDSTVVSWLKKIYYKLGGASVNTKPVDPVGDPDGTWDWLSQLIEGILAALANGAANLAGSLGDLFQGIKDKFPFSIPWDIVAIVALLDAPPVTPEFVIEYDVFDAHVRYDIDLHFFDEQAVVIRAMENVLFCAFLLFKTDWLGSIFDGIGDFLGGKLKSTVKGA